ncbi:hypothetical protein B9Z65_501 [Elsinoe australis]|uniref:Uncharacterized protein n=1 Tax=Elsinoe australis TaxID=40998 RepID=A0A2P8AIS5_9PEZI|nr:hypothetical protein B9Z65_501 [Elsinoe australis]
MDGQILPSQTQESTQSRQSEDFGPGNGRARRSVIARAGPSPPPPPTTLSLCWHQYTNTRTPRNTASTTSCSTAETPHHADVAAPPSAHRLPPYITLNTTSLAAPTTSLAAPTTAPAAASTATPLISILTSSLVCTLTSTVLVLLI